MANNRFFTALGRRQALKVIAGIHNTDLRDVLDICKGAAMAGAHAVDIAADPVIVASVIAMDLPISVVVSSLDPAELAAAAKIGADVLELGNFDAQYEQGDFYSADDVYELAADIRKRCPNHALCVTIPGHLSTITQQMLAKSLTELGVNMLQTEGAIRLLDRRHVKALDPQEKVALTLRNTQAIDHVTHLPVITASGLTTDHLMDAFLAGASGVGVGSSVRQAADRKDAVAALLQAMPRFSALALAS
jgi:thiamine monophosphate synthase